MKPEELNFGRIALEKGLLRGLGPADDPAAEELPKSLGGFEIRGRLGWGAMGRVYRAHHPGLNKDVALKVLKDDEVGGILERFKLEAEAAGRLSHPNIVPIHDARQEGLSRFIVMDLIEGETLEQILDRGPVPSIDAEIARLEKVARAVAYAHDRGVIHRDLKPDNILVDARGEPHLVDFGLARIVEQETTLTKSGTSLGTPAYMPPEQARGAVREMGPASDVYSLGVILYRILAGRVPFEGSSLGEVYDQILRLDPTPPSRWNPACPRDAETVCLKALEKRPDRRYATAAEFADELGRILKREPVAARPAGLAEKLWRRSARHRPVLLTIAAASIALAAGLGWMARSFTQRRDEIYRRESARSEALKLLELARPAIEKATQSLYRVDVDPADTRRDLEKVRVPLEEARRLAPDLALPHYLLGRAWELEDREEEAEACWRRAIELDSTFGPARFHLAKVLLIRSFVLSVIGIGVLHQTDPERATRLADEAVRELERATAAGSGFEDDLYREIARAMIAFVRRDLDTALSICREGIHRFRGREGSETFLLLTALASRGERQLEAYNAALAIRPKHSWVLLCRAIHHMGQGNHLQSIADCDAALRVRPGFPAALLIRGNVRQLSGDLPGAIADFSEVLRIDPRNEDAWFNRGNARMLGQEWAAAIDDYTTAGGIRPEHGAVYQYRGMARLQTGDLAGALADFDELIRRHPEWPQGHMLRGELRLQQGFKAEAAASLRKALDVLPAGDADRARLEQLLEQARQPAKDF